MDGFTRYAVCYTPPPGPLADFGAAWLGWDSRGRRRRPHPQMRGLPRPVARLTDVPRRYGFHATLKPPFALKPGFDISELHTATGALAASLSPVAADGLRLVRLGGFLALMPEGDTTPLALLAARIVETLDGFRAAPSEADLARHRKPGLTSRQEVLLQQWGYPHVMEEFRFHLTLTGPLPEPEAEQVAALLRPALAPLLPRPFRIREICLVGEGQDGRFHHLHRYRLSG